MYEAFKTIREIVLTFAIIIATLQLVEIATATYLISNRGIAHYHYLMKDKNGNKELYKELGNGAECRRDY